MEISEIQDLQDQPEPAPERTWRDQRGASLVEYALLLALIAIACISALSFFGARSTTSVGNSCHQIVLAGGGASAPGC